MNRKIKFRGKKIYNGEWAYGDLATLSETNYRIVLYEDNDFMYSWSVIPETIGQFTGFYDKNGKEIYEGDILESDYNGTKYWVIFENGGFYIHNAEKNHANLSTRYGSIERSFQVFKEINIEIEIIGNIYENPELLEK